MKTQDLLNNLPEIHLNYLQNLKATRKKAAENRQTTLYEQTTATARGYIKALEHMGVIDSFKTLYIWFTV